MDLWVRKGVVLSTGWSWKASWRKTTQPDLEAGVGFREGIPVSEYGGQPG